MADIEISMHRYKDRTHLYILSTINVNAEKCTGIKMHMHRYKDDILTPVHR